MMQLAIRIRGEVISSNFETWKRELLNEINGTDSELVTDAQFARGQEQVKFFKRAERALKEAKAIAIQRVSSINDLFSAIDEISAETRAARLSLERQIRKRKEEIKREFVDLGLDTIKKYLSLQAPEFQEIDHSPYLDRSRFAAAIKGKATINTLNTAISKKCDQIKHAIDVRAQTVAENLETIRALPIAHQHLLQDLGWLLALPPADLAEVIKTRIAVLPEHPQTLGTTEDTYPKPQNISAQGVAVSRAEAVAILSAICAGCDPDTGEILPPTSSLRNPKLLAALLLAISALKSKPEMAGEK